MWQAKIIAHSISKGKNKKEIITWELIYPRLLHSELMTHRMLSKNAASSRAIPVQKVIDMVRENPATPIFWGKNRPGMQAVEEIENWQGFGQGEYHWYGAANDACNRADVLNGQGYHKQIVNRLLEPFQWMKTVVTGTEWENFYWLRNHKDAQPEFKYLVELMLEALKKSNPNKLEPGDWHTPYYRGGYWFEWEDGVDIEDVTLQDALAISMSCCAQVSYRTLDDSLEKAHKVVDRLNLDGSDGNPVHSSPSEHQATPMQPSKVTGSGDCEGWVNAMPFPETWEDGITAYHKELGFMSGNLSGWVQNRQLIKGHTKW